ncbi:16S rRNA (adenine(1518)-N(6)/adenine(1519)-N(6))-dimethyltransferase RsmA [Capnocytophaga felis]|uniref:Ribosomal RNA small subunit methyltransferase A n=1 Tax=Capnocytophaga felis TaxID=2267611 RepID=A0A5M4B6R1_9FLAO|nr:16S rRNA (adenine(1518)-N(6)/adenine(1519)-N(6))-dimethyltransferase RsmA [Capnocytophaga felis]GET44947.1 ribosomal RNA small subunit methyltransferase A [Capnocytophaga felis]GET47890.1 ribosomal RNA small subunit methyltransferase A [Capnocytophaga felis]
MEIVKAKKHLGQHFLKDLNIAEKIADTLSLKGYTKVLEIGPGMGVLTQFLLKKDTEVHVIEIDKESVSYLEKNFPTLQKNIISGDFLKFDILSYFRSEPFAVIGNFPYNISSQIIFRTLELRDYIPEFSGMFQKEVAERICEKPGSKTYGILSVLTQAFYEAEYLFTVSENVFNPPPKVKSGVLRLQRKANYHLDCDEKKFFTIVKTAFNQRRKTLRNSLKQFLSDEAIKQNKIFDKRPEQLFWQEFLYITNLIEEGK